MSIIRPNAPLSATAALMEGLPAFLSDHSGAAPVLRRESAGTPFRIPTPADLGFQVGGNPPDTLPDFSPIHVFVLGVGDVMKGLGVNAAVSGGWRYHVGNPASHVVMAWVTQRPPSGMWKVAATFYGPGVRDSIRESTALRTSAPSTSDFELRMLSMPALNLELFHLKSQTPGARDMFSPFPNMTGQLFPGLNTQPFYSEAEILAAIRAVAMSHKYTIPKSGG
jgi:hypothetical protein